MKTSYIAALALLSTALTPTTAFADTVTPPTADAADATTLAAMQAHCDTVAAGYGPSTGANDHYSAEVVEGAVTLFSGPTEVGGTRDIDEGSIQGTGTLVPSVLEIRGNPVKIGGSVNMFGDQWATSSYYPDSTYNFTADFDSTFAHAFSCSIYQEVYHAAYSVHHDRTGVWAVDPDFKGNEEAATQNCNAFNQSLPAGPPQGGNTQANCIYNETSPAYDENFPESWDDPVQIATAEGTPINQDQTDTLNGFEDHGGIVYTSTAYHVGQPVICISPGSKGGSWRAQNGYSGGSFSNTNPATPGCNTNWFKFTGWYAGSQTSNGTFVSVPDYYYP